MSGVRHRRSPASTTCNPRWPSNEALLSFQVGLWETYEGDYGGGSWLIAVTKNRRTVHRLPDRARLSPVVPVFVGLLEGGQGRETPAAVRLYEELLSDAVASLPPEVTRLVIVADGALHHLPFEALRATPEAPPLGARYELVQAPSATLWLQWRATAPRAPAGRMLTLADPALAGGVETEAQSRDATLLQGLRLGRLPHAREESRAIERHVGGVEALIGESASEKALKSRDLGAYDIVHFAAHAVADEAHPERSAVLLAPGDAVEDGLLQVREIEALDLDGRIVVLSACHTAAGVVLSGEGVLSLARAFFEAGAHAVVGSRWPLRDVDAAALFDTFYRHLGQGASLSQALKATQDEARAAGRPASAWAGLVLLGNGDLRPFAGGRPPTDRWPWLAPPLASGVGTPRPRACPRAPARVVRRTGVKTAVAEWRRQRREVFILLTYRPGDLAEVDFFEVLVDVAGTRRKAWLFLLRLIYSGRDFASIYERQDQISFLEGHGRASAHFGGVPARAAYDYLRRGGYASSSAGQAP